MKRPIYKGIHLGDTRQLITRVQSESVNLIVTSPPYPGRDDGVHPDDFVAWFMPFGDEFWRVLRQSGSLVLNIREPCLDGERHTCVLSLILAMRHRGWLWVDEYCWHKSDPMPGRWPNRLRDGWERCLHFAKSGGCAFYDEQVKIPIGDWAQRERLNIDDVIASERRTGSGARVRQAAWNDRTMVFPSNVLHFATVTRNVGLPYALPEQLPVFFIRLLTKENDLVLDPFLGSGTTAVVAERLGRRFIGFELGRRNVDIARRRLRAASTNSRRGS
jgi:site-specific DNA-methyltransferase (adenine-specific)